MRAYLDTALQFGIPAEVMEPYFRSMKEDLTVTRFPTFADLLHYMDGSAAPVGRAMTYIVGVRRRYSVEDTLALRGQPLDRDAAQQLLARRRAGLPHRPRLSAPRRHGALRGDRG